MDFLSNFNFKDDGKVTVVRFLHNSVNTFETIKTHWLKYGNVYKHVKCIGDGCPACEKESAKEELVARIYDYSDGKEKVWAINNTAKSTGNLVQKLSEAQSEWGVNLVDIAFKLTCHKNTASINDQVITYFTYDVDVVPGSKYVKPELEVDVKYAIRTASKRSKEDMIKFMTTGVMPPKPEYKPNNENSTQVSTSTNTQEVEVNVQEESFMPVTYVEDDDLPF